MLRKLLVLPLALALTALPLLPAAPVAHAATNYSVMAGAFIEADGIDIDAFGPSTISVSVGDTVTWTSGGFHTVTFTSGGRVPPLLIPRSDPAGGMISPEAGLPAGGNTYAAT